jgi:hypothetical protein
LRVWTGPESSSMGERIDLQVASLS